MQGSINQIQVSIERLPAPKEEQVDDIGWYKTLYKDLEFIDDTTGMALDRDLAVKARKLEIESNYVLRSMWLWWAMGVLSRAVALAKFIDSQSSYSKRARGATGPGIVDSAGRSACIRRKFYWLRSVPFCPILSPRVCFTVSFSPLRPVFTKIKGSCCSYWLSSPIRSFLTIS